MSLEKFLKKYQNLCKKVNIIPDNLILNAIKNSYQNSITSGYILILSEKNLNNDICKILSECFRNDSTFDEILLNDCMLSSDCLQIILEGLSDNNCCTKLNLKGNNIKDHGCELLARFIRQNKTIKNLSLEWNEAGISDNGFKQLCEALSVNKSLQSLDLKNNQIGFDNCRVLVAALKKNTSLKDLDLRYNSLGIAGGKEIMALFEANKCLVKLSVLGNSIPLEMMTQIESLVCKNGLNQKSKDKPHSKSERTTRPVEHYEDIQKTHSWKLVDRIDQHDSRLKMSDKKAFSKIIELEKLLDSRKQNNHQLSAKLNLAESKLDLYETQFKEMEVHFMKSLKEREFLERQTTLQLDKEKDFRTEMEKRFLREQSQLQERILELQNKVGDLEANLKVETENGFQLKEKLNSNQSDHNLKHLEYEESLAKMNDQHSRELNKLTEKKEKELHKMRHECNQNEELWREKLAKYDGSRDELSQEVSRLKSQLVSDKAHSEETILQLKQRLRNEEEQKLANLDEQLRTAQIIKEEIEAQNAKQSREIDNLHKENSKLKIEMESLRIKNDDLTEALSRKKSDLMSEVEKVRLDWMHKVQKLESERQSQADLFMKIEQQDKQIQDMKNSFREELHSKNAEIQTLRDRTRNQELEISRRLEDEKMRVNALQSAVMQYCRSSVLSSD